MTSQDRTTEWVTVRSFSTLVEAQIAQSALENEGIESFVRDEHSIGLRNYMQLAMGGVRLDVHAEDLSDALRVVNVPDAPPEPKLCPRCQGKGEKKPADFPRGLAAIAFWALAGLPLAALKPKFTCTQCGNQWRK